jgi:energy-coupling factor transport system substrate-specific component
MKRPVMVGLVVSLLGISALLYPLLSSGQGQADLAPWLMALLVPLSLLLLATELSQHAIDGRSLALLGLLAACGAALRIPSPGVAGIEPVFFLLVVAGAVFGSGFGFALGALTLLVSAFFTGGIGPWLPFQMLAAAWLGAGAGMFAKFAKTSRLMLAIYTAIACMFYGAVMNLWFWPYGAGSSTTLSYLPGGGVSTNLHRFVIFDLTTSMGFDLPRAFLNALLISTVGIPLIATLRRFHRRAEFAGPRAAAASALVSE